MKQIKIMKVAQGEEKAKTRGNSQYYRKALVGETFRDDGRLWQIQDIKYSQGLDLLNHVNFGVNARKSIEDFLSLKDKMPDNQQIKLTLTNKNETSNELLSS